MMNATMCFNECYDEYVIICYDECAMASVYDNCHDECISCIESKQRCI